MKIALVAKHATLVSGSDSRRDGQSGPRAGDDDVRLRDLSRNLAAKGHRVTIYAQRHEASGLMLDGDAGPIRAAAGLARAQEA